MCSKSIQKTCIIRIFAVEIFQIVEEIIGEFWRWIVVDGCTVYSTGRFTFDNWFFICFQLLRYAIIFCACWERSLPYCRSSWYRRWSFDIQCVFILLLCIQGLCASGHSARFLFRSIGVVRHFVSTIIRLSILCMFSLKDIEPCKTRIGSFWIQGISSYDVIPLEQISNVWKQSSFICN